jgi:predicted small integral membrane protein
MYKLLELEMARGTKLLAENLPQSHITYPWVDMAPDRDTWWALVNTVMNLRVPSVVGYFLEQLHNWKLLKKSSTP